MIKGPAPSRNLTEPAPPVVHGYLNLDSPSPLADSYSSANSARSHGHAVTVAAAAGAVPGPPAGVEPEPDRDSVTFAWAAGGPALRRVWHRRRDTRTPGRRPGLARSEGDPDPGPGTAGREACRRAAPAGDRRTVRP